MGSLPRVRGTAVVGRRQALANLGSIPLLGMMGCARAVAPPQAVTAGRQPANLSRLGAEYEQLMGRHGYAEWARYAGETDPKTDPARQMKDLREAERNVVERAAKATAETAGVDPREAAAWNRAALGLDLLGDPPSAALADELEAVLNDHVFEYQGRRVTRGDLRQMARSDDPKLRRDQHRLYGALHVKAAPIARNLLRRRSQVAKGRGLEQGFYDAMLELRGVPPARFSAVLGELERSTSAAYGRALGDAAAAAKLRRPSVWDSAFLMRQFDHLPDERFPKDQAIPFARSVFGALGVDLDHPKIRIDVRDFAFGGQTISLHIPDDVRAVVNPTLGIRFYATLLHELGHAFDATHTREVSPVLKGYEWVPGLTEPAYSEGIAEVFAGLLDEGPALERFAPALGEEERIRYLSGHARAALLSLRQVSLVAVAFEREAIRDPDGDLDGLERRLAREITSLDAPDDVEPTWAATPFLATYPVYVQSYTLAAMFSHQIRRTLRKKFGALWATPEAGDFLANTLPIDGSRTTTDEKLVRATGAPLGAGAYLEWLTGEA